MIALDMPRASPVPRQPALFTVEPVFEEVATVCRRWRSQVRPEIVVTDERYGLPVLRWADAHPVVYNVVEPGSRSRAYGIGSSSHIGWAQRADCPEAILERVRTVYDDLAKAPPAPWSIFQWRAVFTLDHYHDKGFTGGLFATVLPGRGKGYGNVLTMDYTPELAVDVARRFAAWVDRWREPAAVVVLKEREEVYRWDWKEVAPC